MARGRSRWQQGVRVLIAGVLIALVIPKGRSQEAAPPGFADRVTLVESADAPGRVEQRSLVRLYWQLIKEQGLHLKRLPHVLVMHISPKAAAKVGRGSVRVRTDHCERPAGDSYYQVWLVGEPAMQEYFVGMQHVLQHEFGLHPSEGELKDLVARVAPEEASLDVQSLLRKTVD